MCHLYMGVEEKKHCTGKKRASPKSTNRVCMLKFRVLKNINPLSSNMNLALCIRKKGV